MPALEVLRRRLDSTRDLHGIVRTMKSLSAVRIRQCREAVSALEEYGLAVELGLRAALRQRREEIAAGSAARGAAIVIVFGSDQGLVGPFNARIVELAVERVRELGPARRATLAIGAQVAQQLDAAGEPVHEIFHAPASPEALTLAVQELVPAIDEWRSSHGIERFLLCYNDHVPGAVFAPRCTQLLPVDPQWLEQIVGYPWPTRILPTYAVPWTDLFAALIRESIFIGLFRALAASLASENASRLAAMQSAEERIEHRLAELETEYRQLRQQTITEELLEVAAGFETLVRPELRGDGSS